jgi:topoisomerase-4 subunit B
LTLLLRDLLAEEIGEESTLYEIARYRGERLEFAFTHTTNYGESYFSFVNGQFTIDGGTHQTAFRLGVLKAIDDFVEVK